MTERRPKLEVELTVHNDGRQRQVVREDQIAPLYERQFLDAVEDLDIAPEGNIETNDRGFNQK